MTATQLTRKLLGKPLWSHARPLREPRRSLQFFTGFNVWEREFGYDEHRLRSLQLKVRDRAVERYHAEYLSLAADVPEFQIWALFGEHRAEQNALARLETLAGTIVAKVSSPTEHAVVSGMNRALLSSPIVDLDETAEVTAIKVPTVERGYVAPGFRWAEMQRKSRPASEDWWRDQPRGANLAAFLAAHFASPQAAERPILVLGHPGSGKSLLTKVCAGRLSASNAFTTVRVPLRDVRDPSASVYRQIEETLRESTHGRVEWSRLCETSHGAPDRRPYPARLRRSSPPAVAVAPARDRGRRTGPATWRQLGIAVSDAAGRLHQTRTGSAGSAGGRAVRRAAADSGAVEAGRRRVRHA
jgi:hypothetical protein